MAEPYKFTVTSRTIKSTWRFYSRLKKRFETLNLGTIDQVTSVFGAVKEYTPLYGGRLFRPKHSLSYRLVDRIARHGINMSLTLSNHHFSEEKYKLTIPILERLYRKGNSIIATNDDLARRIRTDFPLYEIKASVSKRISSLDEIHRNLELYDYVVLLPVMNDKIEFLQSIDCKERVILFAAVRCLYNCNSGNCFEAISDLMAEEADTSRLFCKFKDNPEMKKLKIFDLKDERFNGFNYFKISAFIRENNNFSGVGS